MSFSERLSPKRLPLRTWPAVAGCSTPRPRGRVRLRAVLDANKPPNTIPSPFMLLFIELNFLAFFAVARGAACRPFSMAALRAGAG